MYLVCFVVDLLDEGCECGDVDLQLPDLCHAVGELIVCVGEVVFGL